MTIVSITWIILTVIFCVAALYDLILMRLPNWLCAVLFVAFPLFILTAMPFNNALYLTMSHFITASMVLVCGFSFFMMGWIGGGDAKYAAAISLWIGTPMGVLNFLLISSVLGGMLTLAILLIRSNEYGPWIARFKLLQHLADPTRGVPFGIALSIGAYLSINKSFLTCLTTSGYKICSAF